MESRYKNKFTALVKKIKRYDSNVDYDLLRKAYHFSYDAHKNQLRLSGEPYFEHPLEVSMILTNLQMDNQTICGALLHDVAEDTGVTIEEVEDEFGQEIALLVDGVTKIGGINLDSYERRQAENYRKMIISMVKDVRVILIKFADRLHNMRTIDYLPLRKRKRIALETLDVYAPLAHRLGIARIESELEDRGLRILDYHTYNLLKEKASQSRSTTERYVKKISSLIKKELNKINISKVKIKCEPKNFYNIYEKMRQRKLPVDEITDNFAVRIIVEKIEHCYFVLGVVHKLFIPVHDRFRDYVATPKSNMYQSLHTTVIGTEGKMIEILIRTAEMDKLAENGIAVHWIKNKGKINKDKFDQQFVWLHRMLEWQQDAKDSIEFMESFKNDLFHEEIFVFTPNGDLHQLPSGATPVDFAFNVHTDIGYHCIGAKVNRRVVPLDYILKSGDIIEIITSTRQQPNPEWLKFIRTSRAKSKIKKWIKNAIFEQSLELGKEILTVELTKLNIKLDSSELSEIAQCYGLDDINQLFVTIGRGDIYVDDVVKKIAPDKVKNISLIARLMNNSNGIKIQDNSNFLISFGKCCQPIPGDRILGFISKGQGIEIHRADCKKISTLLQFPENNINVEWDVDKNKHFMVQLKIFADKSYYFLKEISEIILNTNTGIENMIFKTENSFIHITVSVEVKNLNQLTRVMNKIRNVDGVINVNRLNSDIA